jgi:hypothetical protein
MYQQTCDNVTRRKQEPFAADQRDTNLNKRVTAGKEEGYCWTVVRLVEQASDVWCSLS